MAKPQGTSAEFFALWQAVEQSGADPDLGSRLGVETLSDYEDVAVLAALHSATLGEGFQKLARYKSLVCPEKVWIDIARGEARLRFEWLLAEDDPLALVTDLLFAFILGRMRERAAYQGGLHRSFSADRDVQLRGLVPRMRRRDPDRHLQFRWSSASARLRKLLQPGFVQ